MKFKLLKGFLSLSLLFLFCSAYGNGTRIGDIYYILNSTTKTAEVTYSTTVLRPSQTLRSYNYVGITNLTIPSTVDYNGITYSVTSIGECAFYQSDNDIPSLISVTIPNSVTTIGEFAFYKCTGLTNLAIPNSVTSIGDHAFTGCSGLTSITIPNSVTSIGSFAFRYCIRLTSITIPNSVTSIGSFAFQGCSGLTSITIPNSVTKLISATFYDCSSLTEVTIPNSVTSIGPSDFYHCSSLTEVTIPNSVTSIGGNAFAGCSGLIKSAYPNTLSNPFSNGINIAYPNDAEFTEDGVIYDSGKKTLLFVPLDLNKENFIIPNSVTSIRNGAFAGCSGLTSINFPKSVISIENSAFAGCSSLKTIYFNSEQLLNLGNLAFDACNSIENIYCNTVRPPTANNYNVFSSGIYQPATVYVPAKDLSLYYSLMPWDKFTFIVGLDQFPVVDAVEQIQVDTEERYTIFNLNGVCVKSNGTKEDVDGLAPGIYIINGKKVVKSLSR